MNLKIYNLIILTMIMLVPLNATAMMQSDSYIIYENVLQTFDGPVINNVACAAGQERMTVAWNTDVAADSYVIYDTANNFANAKEQGASAKTSASHSVIVTGLAAGTYYYKVKSTRINGGTTTDNTVRTCSPTVSAATLALAQAAQTIGGGGLLIIDKTDKAAPIITNVLASKILSDSATIAWTTDEDATSFIEYGRDVVYGKVFGQWTSTKTHNIVLQNLTPETEYHFRALASDGWGNLGKSADYTLKTISAAQEKEMEEDEEGEEVERPERTWEDFISLIPQPKFAGDPTIIIEYDKAVITWKTDKDADSLIALAPEGEYKPGEKEPYRQFIGADDKYARDHQVQIFGLEPNTLYHFQLRSKVPYGKTNKSKDYTFRTKEEALKIISFYPQVINVNSAVFKWVTNLEADSAVKITAYRGDILAEDAAKTIKDNTFSAIHEIAAEEFMPGIFYNIELISMDKKGNEARQAISKFSTAKDDLPPEIYSIKTDSTIFLNREGKIQTIISWLTNEPSTSKVYYQEGVQSADKELNNQTDQNTDYTKEHIMVFTKFQPGKVYSFRVESVDAGGNATLSNVYTFMTPKKKESIFQIIIRILEQTFGWIKTIGK